MDDLSLQAFPLPELWPRVNLLTATTGGVWGLWTRAPPPERVKGSPQIASSNFLDTTPIAVLRACLDLSSELQGTYCVPEIMLTVYYTSPRLIQQQSLTHIIDKETEGPEMENKLLMATQQRSSIEMSAWLH